MAATSTRDEIGPVLFRAASALDLGADGIHASIASPGSVPHAICLAACLSKKSRSLRQDVPRSIAGDPEGVELALHWLLSQRRGSYNHGSTFVVLWRVHGAMI